MIIPIESQLTVCTYMAEPTSTDKGNRYSAIRQRRYPKQLVRCKLKALTQLLKGTERHVSLSYGDAAKVSRTEVAALRGFLIAEITAAAQLENGRGQIL